MRFFFFLSFFIFSVLHAQNQTKFTDVTDEAGIDHIFDVYQGLFGGGVAVFDYNNDGYEDLFLTSGQGKDILYRNNGDGNFSDVTEEAGLVQDLLTVTTGVSTADINKDGFIDIFITTIAAQKNKSSKIKTLSNNLLYLNTGEGTFVEKTEEYGIKDKNFSTSCSFGDINADGYPDLFVANYFKEFYFEQALFGTHNLAILNHYSINEEYEPGNDELYLNMGGKSFKNVSNFLKCNPGYGFGAVFTDVDNDNDLDIYLVNDFGENNEPNQILINQYPKLDFENKSKELKLNVGLKSMGVGVGDYNNDSYLDYHVTNIFAGPFMVNRGKDKSFVNLAPNIGTGINKIEGYKDSKQVIIGWGSLFVDYDHDQDLDLFNSNGPINPMTNRIPNILFENKGRFFDVCRDSGLMDFGIGRGSVHFDYDNDGDQDIFVVNQKPVYDMTYRGGIVKSKLYRNDNSNDLNWLKVKLNGKNATTRGLGSRVKIFLKDNLQMVREVDGGSSHASQNTSIVHFGLGENTKIDSLSITWPGGKTQSLVDIAANQLLEVDEIDEIIEYSLWDRFLKYFSID